MSKKLNEKQHGKSTTKETNSCFCLKLWFEKKIKVPKALPHIMLIFQTNT